MDDFAKTDPVIDRFIAEWNNPQEYWWGDRDYHKSIFVMHRMLRYISTSINMDNLRMGCAGALNTKNGSSFVSQSMLGAGEHISSFDANKNKKIIDLLGPDFQIDVSKHSIICHPWHPKKISNYTMLMAIENPKHDFYDLDAKDEVRFDLILPWGIFVVSGNGNHRAMGAILSGVGKFPISYIQQVEDFEPFISSVDPSIIKQRATPFGRALYEIALLMIRLSEGREDTVSGSEWLTRY